MTDRIDQDYWRERADRSAVYRGERLYTVTPAGFYVRRRGRLLAALDAAIAELPDGASVLDFGCGDGFCAAHVAESSGRVQVFGCDASPEMITLARQRGSRCELAPATGGIPFDRRFDLILVVAVLAHVTDETALPALAADLAGHLADDGRLMIFEAVTLREPTAGASWRRRSIDAYRTLFAGAGLTVTDERLIAFPFYNRVGRRICHAACRHCFGNDFVEANDHRAYQWLTDSVMILGRPFDRLMKPREGNVLMTFRRGEPS